MKNKHYIIVVIFKAKSGKELMLKEHLTSIVNIALKSLGCISHDLHQSLNDSSEFMFYEKWISREAHKQHVIRPEVIKWRDQLKIFLVKPYEASDWEVI
jgi:quinol monooxygenase YgiN